jgi:peptide-methionine (R)-S-oxide reductase
MEKKLTPKQYRVLRQKGTDPPFSGELLHNEERGEYVCAACGNVVFDSSTKFDSGSGWPSFNSPATEKAVNLIEDNSLGMNRVEVVCAKCGSHLGHLFNDAYDQPTGERFCINSTSLKFDEKEK